MLKLFLSLTLGGTALGVVVGFIGSFFIRRISNDAIMTMNVTFICCYLTFFTAENVNIGITVSGIMAIVALGLFMGIFAKTRIAAEDLHVVEIFWKYIVYAAESMIFLIAGMLVALKVFTRSPDQINYIIASDYYRLIGLYFCMTAARFSAICVFYPYLKTWGERIILFLKNKNPFFFSILRLRSNDERSIRSNLCRPKRSNRHQFCINSYERSCL